jgi:hypothetical protein
MNLTMLNAAFVMSQCARFTALSGLVLRAQDSILQILNKPRRSEQDLCRCI